MSSALLIGYKTGFQVDEETEKKLNYNPDDPDKMDLPIGKTCGDCSHMKLCKAIYGHVETDTSCDWSPSRFVDVGGIG